MGECFASEEVRCVLPGNEFPGWAGLFFALPVLGRFVVKIGLSIARPFPAS
jgi:hypothetical protein